jgi:sulfoxide reductase heme-binding subunit YedZ
MSGFSRHLPATDRAGRFSPVKALAWLGALAPALWLVWTWRTAGLGPKPASFVIHSFGDFAVWSLIATLCVTPLRRITRWSALHQSRRIFGNFALAYALAHLASYVVDVGAAKAVSEIGARVYLTIGLAALAILITLGATSNDAAVTRLGAAGWNRLHRAIYVAATLALVHYFLQSKNDVTPALLQAGLFLLLMGWRLLNARTRGESAPWLVALAFGAGLATALVEAGWYFWRSGLPPLDVLSANLDVQYEIRPPLVVAAFGFGGAALAFALSLWRASPNRTGTARRR